MHLTESDNPLHVSTKPVVIAVDGHRTSAHDLELKLERPIALVSKKSPRTGATRGFSRGLAETSHSFKTDTY